MRSQAIGKDTDSGLGHGRLMMESRKVCGRRECGFHGSRERGIVEVLIESWFPREPDFGDLTMCLTGSTRVQMGCPRAWVDKVATIGGNAMVIKSLIFWVVTLVLALSSSGAMADGNERHLAMFGDSHMWGEWGWGSMIFRPVIMVLYIALILGAIVLVVRWFGGELGARSGANTKTALQILEERFARGEIDKGEYEERRRVLTN